MPFALRSLLALLLLATSPALGQTAPSATAAWRWGARLGLGHGRLAYGDSRREYYQTYLSPSGGLTLSRPLPRLRASVHAEALYLSRTVRVSYARNSAGGPASYRDLTATSHHVFLPLYLRTGVPGSFAHFLVGVGPVFHLGTPTMPAGALYYPNRTELTGLLGLEVRVAPLQRFETTLGLHLRMPLTPTYAYGANDAYSQGGQTIYFERRSPSYAPWLGLTLATVLRPGEG